MSILYRIIIALAILALAFVLADRASAAEEYATVKNWAIVSHESGCSAVSDFTGNNGLGFVVNSNGGSLMMVARQGWKLSPGKYKGATVQVDSGTLWGDGEALVVEGHEYGFALKVPLEFLREVAEGNTLKISTEKWQEAFDLSGTKAALARTVECVGKLEQPSPFTQPVLDSESPFVKI